MPSISAETAYLRSLKRIKTVNRFCSRSGPRRRKLLSDWKHCSKRAKLGGGERTIFGPSSFLSRVAQRGLRNPSLRQLGYLMRAEFSGLNLSLDAFQET